MTGNSSEKFRQGILHFNQKEFFEAHEVWEAIWLKAPDGLRDLYKGLIQSAVALHHAVRGNLRGALKVYRTSMAYLENYPPDALGLDLEKFRRELIDYFAAFERSRDAAGLEIPFLKVKP